MNLHHPLEDAIAEINLAPNAWRVYFFVVPSLHRFGLRPLKQIAIAHRLGITQPAVSSSLQALVDAGLLLQGERDGQMNTYGLNQAHPVSRVVLYGMDLGLRVPATL